MAVQLHLRRSSCPKPLRARRRAILGHHLCTTPSLAGASNFANCSNTNKLAPARRGAGVAAGRRRHGQHRRLKARPLRQLLENALPLCRAPPTLSAPARRWTARRQTVSKSASRQPHAEPPGKTSSSMSRPLSIACCAGLPCPGGPALPAHWLEQAVFPATAPALRLARPSWSACCPLLCAVFAKPDAPHAACRALLLLWASAQPGARAAAA